MRAVLPLLCMPKKTTTKSSQKSSKKLHGAAKVTKALKGAKFPKKKGKQKGKK